MTAVEVITSVERRRRWSRDEKLRIVAESARPGRTTSQVARDHGMAPSQLFTWRRQLRSEALAGGVEGDGFVPVAIANEAAGAACAASAGISEGIIEIRLPNGIVIVVRNVIEVEPLRRVLSALGGR